MTLYVKLVYLMEGFSADDVVTLTAETTPELETLITDAMRDFSESEENMGFDGAHLHEIPHHVFSVIGANWSTESLDWRVGVSKGRNFNLDIVGRNPADDPAEWE